MRRPRKLLLALAGVLLCGCASLRPFAEVRREVPASSFLSIRGRLVHVEQAGAGEPVLLIHGFGASTYSWRKVIPGLAARYRVVALDLNGFGWTERPRDPASYTPAGQARLILGVLDALGISRAHFVGHSYGGAITLHVASRHPERVRSMVLVDSAAPSYPDERRTRVARLRGLNSLFLHAYALRPRHLRQALERSLYDDSLVTPEMVAAYLDRLRIEGISYAFYGLTAPSRSPREAVDLAAIDVPALVVWGAQDEIIPLPSGRAAARRLPRVRVAVIEQAGHMPMEEKPDELVRLVTEFIAGQSPPEGREGEP